MPERSDFRSAYDALQLHACGMPAPETKDVYTAPTFPTPTNSPVIFVDSNAAAEAGSGRGDKTNPFKSLEAAVASITAGLYPAGPKTIVLKEGTYYTAGVVLTTDHSNLTIQNYDGEAVVVSGAVPIVNSKPGWSIHNKTTNTWKLDTKGQRLAPEYGMRVGDTRSEGGARRAIRAKYPNGDPETAPSFCFIDRPGSLAPLDIGTYGEGAGVSMALPTYFAREHAPINTTQTFTANPWDWPAVNWHASDRLGVGPYFYAAGGVCSGRTPPHGYWCSEENPRGSSTDHINPPGGFEHGTVLPQAASYSNPKGAIFHARGGSEPYFTYMCLVSGVSNGSVYFDPAVGCDQGAEGLANGKAWDWWIENVKEECDSHGEYYFDPEEEALYYTFNGTDTPTGGEDLSLTRTKVLFNISGTMADPVKNVTIRGLTLRDAAYTYLGTTEADRHWLPTEGDWALQRSGAITLEGVERVRVDQNQLTRLDGNGIFIGGYARGVSVTRNDMNWIGGSAVAAFGWSSDCLYSNCSVKLPAKVGPDGRGGEQPRGTVLAGNLVREYGVWQKQSSAYFGALAAATTIESNVFFNGPRAAINFNDPFGGGDVIRGNLIFNHVRETVDHGNINIWDRGPYVSDIGYVRDYAATRNSLKPTARELMAGATPGFTLQPGNGAGLRSNGSATGQYRRFESNFLVGVYNVITNVETDDGASRTLQYNNYFVYADAATDFALRNAQWQYFVNNVHAYAPMIIRGWGGPPANCHVYNSTFYMLGESALCTSSYARLNMTFEDNVVHLASNDTAHAAKAAKLDGCPGGGTDGITLAPAAEDAAITAAAKKVLGAYPKPYRALG